MDESGNTQASRKGGIETGGIGAPSKWGRQHGATNSLRYTRESRHRATTIGATSPQYKSDNQRSALHGEFNFLSPTSVRSTATIAPPIGWSVDIGPVGSLCIDSI